LVQKNIALVKSVVKRFLGRNLDYDDLFQLGCMGLVKAIINYDPSFCVRFSTYAVPLILGEIRRFLRDDGAVKVARPVKELYARAMTVSQRLGSEFGREAKIEEIAEAIGCNKEDISQCLEAARMPVSLNAPLQDDGGKELTLDDCLGCEDNSERTIDRILLREMLGSLAPRERKVIFLRYFEDRTQSEIAAFLGISQVQVSRLESKIIKKLRGASASLS
jgi:RNA polymerase sporulation-specific sigma factor